MRLVRPPRPLPRDNPHGVPVGYRCGVCRSSTAAYGADVPQGWEHDGKRWTCPRCSRNPGARKYAAATGRLIAKLRRP